MSSSSSTELPRTRPVVAGAHAAVASAHPLASGVGIDVLKAGGNAVDAVVAMAVALGVVEPYMSGVGGVGFLLLHEADGATRVLNFCGNTPAAATPDKFTNDTKEHGIKAPLIPGNVAGWFEAHRQYGLLPVERLFSPAIEFAERGFPLHPFNVTMLRSSMPRLNQPGLAIYGHVPLRIGAILKQPDLGRTLRTLVSLGPDHFYRGELAGNICRLMRDEGGLIGQEDLAGYKPDWEEPIEISYRGLTVKTCPPNNEGFQILQTLKLLEADDLAALGHNSADYIHIVSEAVKLAIADRIRWAGDPKFSAVPLDRLLSASYIGQRRKLIDRQRASYSEGERWRGKTPVPTVKPGQIEGMTTHLAAVDEQGNVASITQSLGNGFGSGVVVPGTGVALNSFAHWCEIDPECPTPNLMAPGKRWAACMAPVHVFRSEEATLRFAPLSARLPEIRHVMTDGTRDENPTSRAGGKFWFSVATPGSYGILHTTVQMLLNVIEFRADCQAAIEAPRFRLWEDTRMQIETRVPAHVLEELSRRGHHLEMLGDYNYVVGGGQAVMIDPETGARLAGADPRRDGYALAY